MIPSKDAKTKKYILSGLLVAFLTGFFSIQAAAATTFTLTTDTYTYTDDGYYNLTIRTPNYAGFMANEPDQVLELENTHLFKNVDFEIIGGPDPSGAATRYINGYFNLRVKIYFDFLSAVNFTNLFNFDYKYTAPVLTGAFFASGRPQIYYNSNGFYLQVQLYGFFDNFIFHDNEQFSFGSYSFDFMTEGATNKCNIYADVSSMTNKAFTVTNHASSSGSVEIISLGVQDAINNASDINTIISLLSAANTYNAQIVSNLENIANNSVLVNSNLTAIIGAINEIGSQTNQSLSTVINQLDSISQNTENIVNQMPDFDLASVSSDLQSLYSQVTFRIPYFPSQSDQTTLWSWLNLPIPFYFLGFTLIFALMGYIVYGKNK